MGEFTLHYDQFKLFKDQISTVEKSLQSHVDQTPRLNAMYQLLLTIPGMGPITSSALIGCIGDVDCFGSGRQMVKWSAIWGFAQRFVKARVSHYLMAVSPGGATVA